MNDFAVPVQGHGSTEAQTAENPRSGRSGVIVQNAVGTARLLRQLVFAPRQMELRAGGPGRGHLEVDRVERASDHVVAKHGHPFRRVGMDRHLTFDRDADTRRHRLPDESRPACEDHRLDRSSDDVGGVVPSAPEDSEEIRVKPVDPRISGFTIDEIVKKPALALDAVPPEPWRRDAMLSRADPQRIFASGIQARTRRCRCGPCDRAIEHQVQPIDRRRSSSR